MDNFNVLVVDDEDDLRESLVTLLKTNKRLNLFEADDGLTALDVLKSQKIDLLITDVNMKQMNGFALIEKSKSDLPYLPKIFVITGYTNNLPLAEKLKDVINEIFPKPFSVRELMEKIKTLFQL